MATSTIDYDALAKQAGAIASMPAGIDYDALAKQAGAVASSNPSGTITIHPDAVRSEQWAPFNAPSTPQAQTQKPPPATDDERRTMMGFLGNVASSTGHLLGGMVNVPGQVQGLTSLFAGMAEKSGFKPLPGAPETNAVDALIAHYKDRYGSFEGFKKALYEDPAGIALDVATVLEPTAIGLKAAGLPEAASVTARLARTINPAALAVRGAVAAAPLVQAGAETAADVAGAAKAGVQAAIPDVARGAGKAALAYGASELLPLPAPLRYGLGIPTAYKASRQIAAGLGKGWQAFRDALAAPEAGAAATEVAPVAPEVIGPERQITTGSIVTPAPADTSFVRSVPAQYPDVETPAPQPTAPLTPLQQYAANPETIPASSRQLPADVTAQIFGGTGVLDNPENVYQYTTPEGIPVYKAPQTTPEAPIPAPTPTEPATGPLARNPAALKAAQELQIQLLTNYAIQKQWTAGVVDDMKPADWQEIAQDVGTVPPGPEQIARIKANLAQGGGGEAPAAAAPTGGPTGPTLQPGHTAVANPELEQLRASQLEPMPPGVPEHYRPLYLREGATAAARAFTKDQQVANYVLGKGITPEQWEALPLEEQNKLVRAAPTASGKGKHLAYVEEPEPGALRTKGRWAHEGVADVANTMRWMEEQGTAPVTATRAEQAFEQAKQAGAEDLPIAPKTPKRRSKPKE